MSATYRPDSQMSALFGDTALSCRNKIDPDRHNGWHLPFFFLYQSMYAQPAKNLSIRSLVYNTIGALSKIFLLTTTTHNNQQSHAALSSTGFSPLPPWLGRRHHQLMVPPLHWLAQGARRRVRQRRCWFPCLGSQREPYQKIDGKAGSCP